MLCGTRRAPMRGVSLEEVHMKLTVGRVASTAIVAGLLGFAGAGYAYAQSSSSTPSTSTPGNAPGNAPGHSSANCPNMGTNSSTSPSQM